MEVRGMSQAQTGKDLPACSEDELFGRLNLIGRMYDSIRLVDPVAKRVLRIRESRVVRLDGFCYDQWQRGTFCNNCISLRAFLTNETQYKLEYSPRQVCQVTAVPVEMEDRRVVAEIIKDVTKSYMITGTGGADDVTGLIDSLNLFLMQDALTGISNRRFIDERLYVDTVDAVVRGSRFAILMGDIDHFKAVNDEYGHLAGDAVLRTVAGTLQDGLRKGDWAARYGGEEFVVCLYDAGREEAAQVGERLRAAVEASVTEYEGHTCRVTMSFGVGVVSHPGEITVKAILGEADRNLYRAKQAGRNRVFLTGQTPPAMPAALHKDAPSE